MRAGRRASVSAEPPDRAVLHAAAVDYLGRYAASAAGVRRVLHRRIDRWAAQVTGERAEIAEHARAAKRLAGEIVTSLVQAGAIDDATFAANRARSLAQAGRSGRAIAAHLLGRGIDADTATANAAVSEEDELAAALALTRRRRIGPFRTGPADPTVLHRETGVLARAGFSRSVAVHALGMSLEQAEIRVRNLRSS